jgi:hypothetical protein
MPNLETWIAIKEIIETSSDVMVLTEAQADDLNTAIIDEAASATPPNAVFLGLPIQIK